MSKIIQEILNQYHQNHTSKSFLIVGPRGIGKKELVNEIGQSFFGNKPADLLAGLKWIECGLTEESKKTLQKKIGSGELPPEQQELDYKTEITVDELKSGLDFLALKSVLPCKILAISLAEEMNENAQNALLKTLEEPYEKTLIFLLSENPHRLLPTILSRCQRIVLHSMTEAELSSYIQKNFPQITDVEQVVQLSDGIPGIAKMICQNNGVELYQQLSQFLCPVSCMDIPNLFAFFQNFSKDELTLVSHFILHFLRHNAFIHQTNQANKFSSLYSWVEDRLILTESLYLDKQQILIDVILKIAEVL